MNQISPALLAFLFTLTGSGAPVAPSPGVSVTGPPVGPTSIPSQRPDTVALTVPSIMRGPELVGDGPSRIRWTPDGEWVYFRWKAGGVPWDEDPSTYRVRWPDGEPEELSEEAADSLGVLVARGDLDDERARKVVAHQGDLWLIRVEDLSVRRLTDTRARESSPTFGEDGGTVYFVRDDDLFALGIDDGSVRQLTDVRRDREAREPEPSPREEWLRQEERSLLEHVRREAEEREEREERRESRQARDAEPIRLSESERVSDLAVEPGGRYAVLTVSRPAADARRTLVPDYVTEDGYTDQRRARPKVGDEQGRARMGLVELATGEVEWLELVPDSLAPDSLVPSADSAAAAGGLAEAEDVADRPALASARFLGWNDRGTRGLLAAVSFDYRDQWLWSLDPSTGSLSLVAHDHDDAWIGGPCAPWTFGSCAGWLPDGEGVFLVSERTGWAQLYRVGADGTGPHRLTRGEWEVHSAEVAPGEDRLFLQGQRESPFSYHFYTLSLDGGEPVRVSAGEAGRYSVTPSPDGEGMAVIHSHSNRPPELYLAELRPDPEMRRVTRSPTDAWLAGPWIEPEIVHFEARDGTSVPARIYRPADLGAEAHGAGVIFVHGAGYLHNVHRWWSSYYREYMFHHILASRGYTVLDIDYRGSAGYGRDWRTAIYRHMGGLDLTDQVDGARYLAEREGVDPERIGIYGGSYGGFITLMALFKHPETFAAGAALRSVTDWAHYNHPYTSRILNLPQDDSVAYRRSSPIYFAEGLEDPLLIAHGMVDTNVHFQDVVRLSQRLIELGKEDWEMAVYPAEPHGFVEPASWTDEYRRILALFEEHLR